MNTKVRHNLKADDLSEKLYSVANGTLTLSVDKDGDFIFTDMGDSVTWNEFCRRASEVCKINVEAN